MRPAEAFIQQPIRSLQTMLQVIALDDNRIPLVIPDGIYGQTTLSAVNRFQQLYELPITGITDQKTWDKIVRVYESAIIRTDKSEPIEIITDQGNVFRIGNTGSYIYFLQVMLLELSNKHSNIPKPNINGTFDELTVSSVSSFQTLSGLPPTGDVDKITWKYLVKQFNVNNYPNISND